MARAPKAGLLGFLKALRNSLRFFHSQLSQSVKRRRARRFHFGGAAVIDEIGPGRQIIGKVTVLSPHGCFVKLPRTVAPGKVTIRILNQYEMFQATGRVVYAEPEGAGIAFESFEGQQRALLQKWTVWATGREIGSADANRRD